jgi:hypothetical protein
MPRCACADLRESCKKRAGREGGRGWFVWFGLAWPGPWLLRSGLLGAHVNLRCQSLVSSVMTDNCGCGRSSRDGWLSVWGPATAGLFKTLSPMVLSSDRPGEFRFFSFLSPFSLLLS